MDLMKLKQNWEAFARHDAMWAIMTVPEKFRNKWHPEEFFDTGVADIDEIICNVKARGYNLGSQIALDFGCGIGRLTQPLTKYFERCYGVDISNRMIELANQYNKHGSRCQYIVNQSDALPVFENNYFDFIYSNIVLQHIERRYTESYLKEFIRILKPDGLLVFQIPSSMNPDCNVLVTGKVPGKKRPLPVRILKTMLNMLIVRRETKYLLGLSDLPAVMEMHCFERSELEEFLKKNGGVILAAERYNPAGPDFISYRYYVTKKHDHFIAQD